MEMEMVMKIVNENGILNKNGNGIVNEHGNGNGNENCKWKWNCK